MSQKKVDAYKKNKKSRESESRKEVRRRRLEICIVIAIIIAGVIWFIVAGVSNSAGKSTTVSIETEAIDNYTNNLQTTDDADAEEIEVVEEEADTAEEETEEAGD